MIIYSKIATCPHTLFLTKFWIHYLETLKEREEGYEKMMKGRRKEKKPRENRSRQLICLVLEPHKFQKFRNPRNSGTDRHRMIGCSGKAKEKRSVAVEAVSFQAPEIPTGARLAERYPA